MIVNNTLLNIYGKYMHLKLFIDNDDDVFKNTYLNAVDKHNNKIMNWPDMIDAGFDILSPMSYSLTKNLANKVDYQIICACKMVTQDKSYNTGFYMYPRSSISKSPFRLANNVGIIDAGYRGHLIGMFDMPGGTLEKIEKYDRHLQICAPGLVPVYVELVSNINELGAETARGEGSFGSTGL
jgi:dUTP pyrophosphatase